MPINQISSNDLHINHTFSGSAEPNARVLLFNPSEGRYVQTVDADSSGNFDFGSLDASVPLQIRIARPNDFTCISISDVIKPAATPQLHTGKMITKLQYFPGSEGQQNFITGPHGVFIDRNGPGTGAEITFELASPGDIFIQPGTDVPYNPHFYPSVGGHPLKAYTITSFGHSYVDPVLILTGTIRTTPSSGGYGWSYTPGINPDTGETYKQGIPGGKVYEGTAPPPPEHFAGYGWEVSGGSWYGKLDIYEEIPCFTCPTDANDMISNLIFRWGQPNTWGQYSAGTPKTYGHRLMAQVPGYSNIKYNDECATEDNTQPGPVLHTNALNQLRSTVDLSSFYNGKYALAYYSIIYGQDPNNINITGFPPIPGSAGFVLSGSAVDSYNKGLISKQELDILKGYFGKELLVGGVLHIVGNQLTNQIVASLLLLGYNIAQGVIQTSILQEMGSVWRQGKGVLETDMSGRVRTILTKMQAATGNNYIDNLQVRDANNVIHQWNFTGSAPTSTAL